jgi:cytidine deaminase
MSKIININIKVKVHESVTDLDEQFSNLCLKAEEAVKNAYAPYSQFYVGAAILLENGEIIAGTNQENAAYPSGTCAERTAIFYASSKFPGVKIKAIAIAAKTKSTVFKITKPVTPCGACRQVIAEYEQKQNSPITILMKGQDITVYQCQSISDLLPLMFNQ